MKNSINSFLSTVKIHSPSRRIMLRTFVASILIASATFAQGAFFDSGDTSGQGGGTISAGGSTGSGSTTSTSGTGSNFFDTGTVNTGTTGVTSNTGTGGSVPAGEQQELSVACLSDRTQTNINTPVNWSAFAFGGNGTYTYSWTGDENVNAIQQRIGVRYTTPGTKTIHLTVTSAGQTQSADCEIEVLNVPLVGACAANVTLNSDTAVVRWIASVGGGIGSYRFAWSGDGISIASTSARVIDRAYTSPGQKTANVSVTSGDQTIDLVCSVDFTSED